MRSSDVSIHRAVVHNASPAGVYVKIPTVLGPMESVSLYFPSSYEAFTVGEQLLVAVEGENFNRVYPVSHIDSTSSQLDGGSA